MMTDREAIEGLEYLISSTCTDSQFDYADEIEHAISALQEREERSKGCVFCEQAASLTSGFLTNACVSKLKWLGGKDIYALCINGGEYRVINFCPMCGRPLKGAEE